MFITTLHNQMSIYFSVCYIAGEFIQHLRKKSCHIEISPEEEYCVRVAALCHDLGKCELI